MIALMLVVESDEAGGAPGVGAGVFAVLVDRSGLVEATLTGVTVEITVVIVDGDGRHDGY